MKMYEEEIVISFIYVNCPFISNIHDAYIPFFLLLRITQKFIYIAFFYIMAHCSGQYLMLRKVEQQACYSFYKKTSNCVFCVF